MKPKRGMVVAPQPWAVEQGARVLRAGGNAFDAAIAAAFTQMVVDFQNCGVAGFGCLTLYDAKRDETVVIDFNATAGGRATPEMWQDRILDEVFTGYGWKLQGGANEIGHGAIATPGTLAGLWALHQKYATLPWADLVAPAIRTAREGWLVSPELARGMAQQVYNLLPTAGPDRLSFSPEGRRIYLKADGTPYRQMERLHNPDYAHTLEQVAAGGAEAFYTGKMAAQIAADIEAGGGTVTLDDLRDYTVRTYAPIRGSYLGYELHTNDAPGGGPTVLGTLNILETYDLPKMGHSSEEYVYTMARAQIAAMRDRAETVGDPRFVDVPTNMLINKERAREWRAKLDTGERYVVPRHHPDSPTTTNVSVADRAGNLIALTHTLGSSNGTITPGLGFMYNNAMNCFDPRPGTVNSIAPGKGRITGIVPTVGFEEGEPCLAIGAPGGTRIMTGVLQGIVNLLAFGMSAVEAVSAPRVDCQSDTLDGESRIPSWVMQVAAARAGLKLVPNSAPYGQFALVQAIRLFPQTGATDGGADPRSGGAAMTD